ncbi:MAG: hypothetical protein DIJKHBIC_02456 [Thermoanaerobaculia bacterium]|nr:hypothetical protein [Thermoanaerobaculia bacterium]
MQPESNQYLGQVLAQQEKVQQELKRGSPVRVAHSAALPGSAAHAPAVAGAPAVVGAPSALRAVDYRITGFWRWKTVVVPPNVYVIHTRRGQQKPLHAGLGTSFGYNPYTDAFLVIPAAMQTIVINANCICIERQGILVQAYVQWIIDDIETAYRKLDFSDPEDPMRIVNVQLREQAEAAIKDKVATMSIDDVLSDKQPIIEELTHRLRSVAEGKGGGGGAGSGLGLKIVTVQIKEAVVSSTRLWEHLQAPFRAEREQSAKLAQLGAERTIAERTLQNKKEHDASILATDAEIALLAAQKDREKYDREQSERVRRQKLEQEAKRRAAVEENATKEAIEEGDLALLLAGIERERRRLVSELEALETRRTHQAAEALALRESTASALEIEGLRKDEEVRQKNLGLDLLTRQQAIENSVSETRLQSLLIQHMKGIAEALPSPQQQQVVTIGSGAEGGALAPLLSLIAGASALLKGGGVGQKSEG